MEREVATDVAKVYELWNEFAAACNAGDLDRWMTLWIEGGIQMTPDTPTRVGKVQIRTAMKPRFEQFDVKDMVIDTGEVRILGDQAYSYGTYKYDMVPKEGGEPTSYSGKFLDIVQKQADGLWKIAIDCHNYNEPY